AAALRALLPARLALVPKPRKLALEHLKCRSRVAVRPDEGGVPVLVWLHRPLVEVDAGDLRMVPRDLERPRRGGSRAILVVGPGCALIAGNALDESAG